ncbi:hypothetical protein R5R35_009198 [Gryllus longicercus]|uniref:Uncharacterized protein n=1 Tax=Gryllus longicercus TaxID=2509291 RepID=A0AAN9Z0B3_9ORTH
MQIPPTDGLDKMASLGEATSWLRAVLTLLLAHEEREVAIQLLRQDRQRFSDPSTQVTAIGPILLLKFNFATPAERRLKESAYRLTVVAKFAGDCSLLPGDVELYSHTKRMHPMEKVLQVVLEDVMKTGRASSSRVRLESPLVELVRGWWDALVFVLAGAEAGVAADAGAAAAAAEEARTPSSPSTSVSSFPSLIVSPCKPAGVDTRRPTPIKSQPGSSPPRSLAPRRARRAPTPYRATPRRSSSSGSSPPRSPAPRRALRPPTPYRAISRTPTPQSTPPSSSPPHSPAPHRPTSYRPKPLSPSPLLLASRRLAFHRPSHQYCPPLYPLPLSPSPPLLAVQAPTPRSTPPPLASRRHTPQSPRLDAPTAGVPQGPTPRKRGRLSSTRRKLLMTSTDTDRSRAG